MRAFSTLVWPDWRKSFATMRFAPARRLTWRRNNSREAINVQSDIYSLGLVLYELFTGKRAFEAASLGELMKLRRSDTTPTTPTSIVKDLDPVIERVIDRCIEKDPAKRPSSALQVAAALPGGDPIAPRWPPAKRRRRRWSRPRRRKAPKPWVAVSLLAWVIAAVALVVVPSGANCVVSPYAASIFTRRARAPKR